MLRRRWSECFGPEVQVLEILLVDGGKVLVRYGMLLFHEDENSPRAAFGR